MTKEHIERLEAELDELRRQQDRDETVRELLRRNKLLEKELRRLRESMPPSITSSPYSAPGKSKDLRSGIPHRIF